MGRHKMTKGTCRLCGKNTDLSFEHVPPKVTFNKNTKYVSLPFDEYFKIEDLLNEPVKGKVKQGGIGYNSFCRNCNSFLGTNYVPAYEKWVKGGIQVLSKNEKALKIYKIIDIEPLKILKHIISMFLAINDEWYLKSYPELAKFVLEPDSQNLPEKFKLFMYLKSESNVRYMHHTVYGDFTKGKPFNCSEIAYSPYGYVITFDNGNEINLLTNITGFKKYTLEAKDSIKFKLFQLPTHINIPLDFRLKDEIQQSIDKGKKN